MNCEIRVVKVLNSNKQQCQLFLPLWPELDALVVQMPTQDAA